MKWWVVLLLLVAALVWLWKLVRALYQVLQAWEIRSFYLSALKVTPSFPPMGSATGEGAGIGSWRVGCWRT